MPISVHIDCRDGRGLVDFTDWLWLDGTDLSFVLEKNQPTLMDISLIDENDHQPTAAITVPEEGSYVEIRDSAWLSRNTGVADGILLTGYVTETPEPEFLGVKSNGESAYGYHLRVTSDEYVLNTKLLPQRTFVNRYRGQILAELAEYLAPGVLVTTGIQNGNLERLYQIDSTKKWSDIAREFAEADGYAYHAIKGHLYYRPEARLNTSGNTQYDLIVDESDPRYVPSNMTVRRVSTSVVNDVTVVGESEPTTHVEENFVSDGYQGSHRLAYVPFGVSEKTLIEDELGSDIDDSVWEEEDDPLEDWIRPFEGSLNLIGGPGTAGPVLAYLRARKGLELTGEMNLRDGEISFPPSPTGSAIIGGLWTDDTFGAGTCWSGWKVDCGASTITPTDLTGVLTASAFTFNPNHIYILRRIITVDRPPQPVIRVGRPETGNEWGDDIPATSATVTWLLQEQDLTDPTNLVTTSTLLLTKTYTTSIPGYVLYGIQQFDAHLVINNIKVWLPVQAYVTTTDEPRLIGSAIDGGVCNIEVSGDVAKLAWYQTTSNRFADPAEQGPLGDDTGSTTIPKVGTKIKVRYRRSDTSMARMTDSASIATQAARFGDDGHRQQIVRESDVTPPPRTSDECAYIARAVLDDATYPTFEGSYAFQAGENDITHLQYFPIPGDRIPFTVNTPGGEFDDTLTISQVSCVCEASGLFAFALQFGAINRFLVAQRQLLQKRKSLTDDPSIETVKQYTTSAFPSELDAVPPDASQATMTLVTSTSVNVTIAMQSGAVYTGFEVRLRDSGWGEDGYVTRTASTSFSLTRDRRDRIYFVKSYYTSGATTYYCNHATLLRMVYPVPNTMECTGITSDITPDEVTIRIPIPRNPDLGGVKVWHNSTAGTVVYWGDGIATREKYSTTTCLIDSGNYVITVPNPSPATYVSFTVVIGFYDILDEMGTINPTGFEVTRVTPVLTSGPTRDTRNPDIWRWTGTATYWQLRVYESDADFLDEYILPGEILAWNIGEGQLGRIVEVIPMDAWGTVGSGGSGGGDADVNIASASTLSISSNYVTNFASWTTPTSNYRTITYWEGQIADDTGFTVGVQSFQIAGATRNVEFTDPGALKYYRIRAYNSFGAGAWSNTAIANTLDYPTVLTEGIDLDDVNNGVVHGKTTHDEVTGAARAFEALTSDYYVDTGIYSSGVYLTTAEIMDMLHLASRTPLGGSRSQSKALTTAAYTPVPEYLTYTATRSFAGLVRVDLWAKNAGVTCTARLYDITGTIAVGTSSGITSQTATETTFAATITAGHVYRLDILSSANNEGVFGIGTLELA